MKTIFDYLGKVSITINGDYNKDIDYDRLCLVIDKTTYKTYISKKPVPRNTPITDESFWMPFSSLKEENEKLVKFKREVEDKEKDQLINSFTMLSDEDKKDVIVNKDKYSLHDIKAQLSIICVDKKVNFSLPNEKENNKTSEKQDVPTTYNLNNHEMDNIPAWLKAVEDVRHRNN